MKFLASILLFLVFQSSTFAETSFEDTMEWIKKHINTTAGYSTNQRSTQYKMTYDESVIKITTIHNNQPFKTVTFDLFNLNKEKIEVDDFGDGGNHLVEMNCKGAEKSIMSRYHLDHDARKHDSCDVAFSSEKQAERLAKALRHAVKLLEAKEPF